MNYDIHIISYSYGNSESVSSHKFISDPLRGSSGTIRRTAGGQKWGYNGRKRQNALGAGHLFRGGVPAWSIFFPTTHFFPTPYFLSKKFHTPYFVLGKFRTP